MQGSTKIIDLLNRQLTMELSSMDQYLAHSKLYEDWGISRLYHLLEHEYDEELGHARKIIERIIFLEGKADTASRDPIQVGGDVKQMLTFDLAAENAVAESLREIIGVCEEEQDYVTRDMLMELLDDTETDHIFWLEQALGLIDLVGIQNYIQSQMKASEG
ncbi:Bacterioferritin [Sinobacterium norvegicum]|uniref:Bacterioferritin n=1 Tax=Sinobacterium norvegicum TaxID=1641715 RepID=A0ABM9AHK4_9GAMM|nr:bacterioferritin [Sinobacterium norvegicum]CAH0992662.1 Bacterioferritin [Sinobacterium norvegicum]